VRAWAGKRRARASQAMRLRGQASLYSGPSFGYKRSAELRKSRLQVGESCAKQEDRGGMIYNGRGGPKVPPNVDVRDPSGKS